QYPYSGVGFYPTLLSVARITLQLSNTSKSLGHSLLLSGQYINGKTTAALEQLPGCCTLIDANQQLSRICSNRGHRGRRQSPALALVLDGNHAHCPGQMAHCPLILAGTNVVFSNLILSISCAIYCH